MKFLVEMYHMTFGFFTTLPVKFIEWDEKKLKYMPLFLPVVGLVIGTISYLLLLILKQLDLNNFLMSVILVVFYILITGGLHLDALMDTSDAHFSRRPRERKLEIMKDSRVGAFAVVSLFVLLSMKIGVFHQLLDSKVLSINLCFIPLISRTIQPLFLYHAPYAAEEGLAKMYGDLLIKKEQVILWLILALTLVVGYYLIQYDILVLIITSLLTYVLYYRFAMKEFNGITGDIIGAYIEIVEVLMLLSLVVFR